MEGDRPVIFNWCNTLDLVLSNGHYRPTDQSKFDQWFTSVGSDPARVVFAIRKQPDLRLLGYLQLVNIQTPAQCAELGVLVGNRADQGQGFGQEALVLGLRYCWRELNLQRVSLLVVGDNQRAIHVYGKVGFQIEGVLRRASYLDGEFRDVTVMGMLRPDCADDQGLPGEQAGAE